MTFSLPHPSERATGVHSSKIVNWNWTLADMDRLEVMARRRNTATEIADRFGTTVEEIRAVCARNGLVVYPRRRLG